MARVLTANFRFLSRICNSSPMRYKSSLFRDGLPPPQPAFVTPDWEKLYQQSLNDPIEFWGRLGASRLKWMEEFHTVMDCDIKVGQHRWFLGGKINVAGAKVRSEIYEAFENIYPILKSFRKT